MISKAEIENIIHNDLIKVLKTEIIYQYAEFDIALEEIILKQSLQFADPIKFNDPFDCNENLLKIYRDNNLIKTTIEDFSIKLSRQEKRELVKKYNNPTNQAQLLKTKKKEYKLSCFSELFDEILMWSHYADKHKGICIGFNFPARYESKFILCPIKYQHTLNELDASADLNRVILYWLTTKSIRWEYEKEIRAIAISKDEQSEYEYINYESKYIKEIIFGCNVSEKKIKEAIRKIKRSNLNYNDITFRRMVINKNNFLLTYKIIK